MAYTEKAKNKHKNAEDYTVKFFLTSLFGKVFASTILLSIIATMVCATIVDSKYAFLVVSGVLGIPLGILMYWFNPLMVYDKLVVSPYGIGLSHDTTTLFIHWQKMYRLEFHTRRGIQTWAIHRNHHIEGLDDDSWQLKLPKEGVAYGFKWMRRFDGKSDMEHFQSTEIGEAFHYYAPWLFEVDGEKRKAGGDGL